MTRQLFCLFGLIMLLTACAQSNRFQGTWFSQTDGSSWVIGDRDVTLTSADHKTYKIHYILRSPSELDIPNWNNQNQIGIIFQLSQDGSSIQATAQAPFGTGTYVMQRVK
jgi:hypothetical protein